MNQLKFPKTDSPVSTTHLDQYNKLLGLVRGFAYALSDDANPTSHEEYRFGEYADEIDHKELIRLYYIAKKTLEKHGITN